MSDYIDRKAARNELYDADAITMKGVAILNNFPSADVVEVVRCKNCKHYMTIHCTCDGCCISDDWYCADGERKDNG